MTQGHTNLAPDLVSALPTIHADLKAIDAMTAEALAVFCFADVRPLAGAAEMLDWRVGGRLSRALERGLLSGALGESALMPTAGRCRRRVFMFGLGAVATADRATFKTVCRESMETLRRAGAAGAAFVAPATRHDPEIEAEFLRAIAEELKGQVRTVLVSLAPDAA
jgi:hypothetical protein